MALLHLPHLGGVYAAEQRVFVIKALVLILTNFIGILKKQNKHWNVQIKHHVAVKQPSVQDWLSWHQRTCCSRPPR
jgi:hypothetical protein